MSDGIRGRNATLSRQGEMMMQTNIEIKELVGKDRDFCSQYFYDYNSQDSYIFSVEPDPKHEAMFKVYYHDGHGGQWSEDEVDPEHTVRLLHSVELARLQAENAQLRAFVERLVNTYGDGGFRGVYFREIIEDIERQAAALLASLLQPESE